MSELPLEVDFFSKHTERKGKKMAYPCEYDDFCCPAIQGDSEWGNVWCGFPDMGHAHKYTTDWKVELMDGVTCPYHNRMRKMWEISCRREEVNEKRAEARRKEARRKRRVKK